MPHRRIAVIVNAAAGSARETQAEQIADAFSARGVSIDLRVVTGDRVAETTRQALQQSASVVAGAGGDGTMSTVASVLADSDADLGVLPLGTLNHFAKDLGIPVAVESAIDTIIAGHTISVDVGEVNSRRFINNSSLGVYPSIVAERVREQEKGRRKFVSLALAAMRVWKRYPSIVVTLRVNGRARLVRTPFVFVGNGEYKLEGIDLTRRKSLTAGQLHICLAPDISRLEAVRMAVAALAGRLHEVEYFEAFFDTSLLVDVRRPVAVSLDGEITVLQPPLNYRVLPKALRVIVPAAARPTGG
jgi:YegS/Rv2252/BmrU family lipid kinase